MGKMGIPRRKGQMLLEQLSIFMFELNIKSLVWKVAGCFGDVAGVPGCGRYPIR